MPRYPGAHWRPIAGHTDGPMRSHVGAVLHVNQSNGNLFNFFNNPGNEVSSHFEIYKNGAVEQYLDTNQTSWCQEDGNGTYLSIETEGYATEPLTSEQLAAAGKLLRWMHETHGIPLQLANKPGDRGLGWHGMGGNPWGGHFGCPGDHRKAQRAEILRLAAGTPAPKPTPPPAPKPVPKPPAPVTLPPAVDVGPEQHYEYQLVTALELKGRGPVYAICPGRFVKVDTPTVALMVSLGLCPRSIHQRHTSNLARLRALSIGANS